MSIPVEYIVTGVVITFAAIWAFFASRSDEEPQKMRSDGRRDKETGRQGPRTYTSPRSPTLPGISGRQKLRVKCTNCGKNPFVKIHPCNHESLCKGCVVNYLKNNDTCPTCNGRIDSCSPPISPYGKCKSCGKFTELFKFLPCNHSLSLCILCFEKQMKSYNKCPVCEQVIRGYEPTCSTSGLCTVCGEFTKFAKFKPCGHGNFCEKHAKLYLKLNDRECSECGKTVTV